MKQLVYSKLTKVALTLIGILILGGCTNQIKSADGSINFPYNPVDLGGHNITILVASRQLEGMGIAVAAFPILPHQTNSYKAKIDDIIADLNLTKAAHDHYYVELTIVGGENLFYITGKAKSTRDGKIEMESADINGLKNAACRIIFSPINKLVHPLVRLHDRGCPEIEAGNKKLNGTFG